MSQRVLLIVVLMLVGGCRHLRGAQAKNAEPPSPPEPENSTPIIENAHVEQHSVTRSWADQHFVTYQCNGAESGPSMHDGMQCGLILNEITAPEYMATFTSQVCGGVDDDACKTRHHDMFVARVEERYPYADYDAVARHCKAWPLKCQSARDLELNVLISHNRGVSYAANQRLAELQAQEQQAYEQAAEQRRVSEEAERAAEAERAEQRRQMWKAVGQAISDSQPERTNCTTTPTYGGGSRTNCTTY